MQSWLYQTLEESNTRLGRVVDFVILVLIIVSVAAYAYSTVPSRSAEVSILLDGLQLVAVIIFSAEYILRLWAAGGKPDSRGSFKEGLAYSLSFYGLIDLLAILPFYLNMAGFIALRSLRILRLLRLFKIGRYSRSLALFLSVLRGRSSQLGVFVYLAFIFIFIAATGIYLFEHEKQPAAFSSIPAALWWAMVTMTTVGYGDVYPVTTGGKVFTSVIVLLGLGIIAIPTGIISAGMVEAIGEERKLHETAGKPGICPTCQRPLYPTGNAASTDEGPEDTC